MEIYETRSSRHIKKADRQKKNMNRFASSMGIALLSVPVMSGAFVFSEEAEATDYEQISSVSPQDFIESIGYSASAVASANDLYASVMIAQALLESSYGNSQLASAPNYNLFGVKGSYNGQTVYMSTTEYLEGQWLVTSEPFRVYSSYYESFLDHANVLLSAVSSYGDYHYSGVWKSNTTSYLDATAALTGVYATDPSYAQKLNWLIDAYGLTRFDSGSDYSYYTDYSAGEAVDYTASGLSSYTVQSGDTLWGIAESYGITVDQLMSLNGLSGDMITVGQIIEVR
ncbi:glucosaminidase domain-containing protein [Enterococcus sp. BWB1-3]|uniref:glucosaminidase domain-containing protein n=1 Tax=Enterococcus sp. BWB1-3 TaxID=2787713 RepID=UPI0019242170|nr:glucosaminidase domain-containing protein [Enterococcus sp. BWB1-3]MBL1231067.1 glucosaminidase domain-containing protein [Enterococcus sp. BWB1-3]